MRHFKKILIIIVCILLVMGCSEKRSTETIEEEITANEKEENDIEVYTIEEDTVEDTIEDTIEDTTQDEVDYDLTNMSSDMVYATVYQMMINPNEYTGKTFRMDGTFYATYYEATKKYYFYCVISDAMACCAQGMEFVWEDGTHIYPEEYPEDNAEIIVEGTFETYTEEGDSNLYCRLQNATLQVNTNN